jgi:hypothetical protein
MVYGKFGSFEEFLEAYRKAECAGEAAVEISLEGARARVVAKTAIWLK